MIFLKDIEQRILAGLRKGLGLTHFGAIPTSVYKYLNTIKKGSLFHWKGSLLVDELRII